MLRFPAPGPARWFRRWIAQALLPGSLACLTPGAAVAQQIPVMVRTVGSGQGPSQIWHIDPAACATRLVGETGTSGLGSLARSASRRLFSVDYGGTLVTVDPMTGAATSVATVTGLDYASVRALTFAPDGSLLAVTKDPAQWDRENHLYRIDATTGQATLVGGMHLLGIQALATASDGRLFAWDMGGHPFWSAGLVTVDPATGSVTDVNASDNDDGLYGHPVKPDLQTLAFSPDGVLYGIGNGNVYVVDASTGQAIIECFGVTHGDGMGAEFIRTEWPRPEDVWLKDCPLDLGATPSIMRCPVWWNSPDVTVVPASDGSGAAVTARVRNRGLTSARAVEVRFLYWDLGVALGRPATPGSPSRAAVVMGQASVDVPRTGARASIRWRGRFGPAWCVGVVLSGADDPASSPLRLAPFDNNVAVTCAPGVSERVARAIR